MDWNELRNTFQTIYRQNRRFFLHTSFIIAISFAIAWGVNFLLHGAILPLFFFLVIPFSECLCICNAEFHATGVYQMKTFYRGYRMSLLPGIHGSFRVIRSFFLSLLVFLGSAFAILLIASLFTSIQDPLFISLVKSEDYTIHSLQNYWIDTSDHYRLLYSLTLVISFGMSMMFFIPYTLNSTQLFYLQTTLLCSKKEAIRLYRQVFPLLKKDYRYLKYRVCGPFYYLFPFGYFLGVVMSITFTSHPFFMMTVAIFIAMLMSAPVLPYHSLLQHHFFQRALPLYKIKGKPMFESMIKMIENNPSISDEQKQVAIVFYQQLLWEVQEMEKKQILTKKDVPSSNQTDQN